MMSESFDSSGVPINPFGSGHNFHLGLNSNDSPGSRNEQSSPQANSNPQNNDVPLIGLHGGEPSVHVRDGGSDNTFLTDKPPVMCGAVPAVPIGDVHSKLDTIKQWSISTYKCTKQALNEKMGKANRTVDLELENKIERVRETQRRYLSMLGLMRGYAGYFQHMSGLQKQLATTFTEMASKEPALKEEFENNAKTQKTVVNNAEAMLSAVTHVISSIQTLCEKTMEDTLVTVRNYENARLEYDAYRTELMSMQQGASSMGGMERQVRIREAETECEEQKKRYERLRDDVDIKIRFLEENRVKVMQKQLLLFHNALSAYYSGNQDGLASALKQFSIRPRNPNTSESFLERNVEWGVRKFLARKK